MKFSHFVVSILLLSSFNASAEQIDKIAFGSCLKQDREQPIWDAIHKEKPDIFVFMGDNIYADTVDPNIMEQKYKLLSQQPGYDRFSSEIPVYATWDDHDYGQNDAGAENPIKEKAEKLFLDFFKVSYESPARSRPGIYQSYFFGEAEKRLQLILLDTRYFRGPSVMDEPTEQCPRTNYGKQLNPDVSILGHEQWEWLAQELKKPAKLRIIVSSIQVIPDEHCWEKWANYPFERKKLFDLLAQTNANGVVLISGDRHLAEISRMENDKINYPLIEITSSGMNTGMNKKEEKNRYRLSKEIIRENNYGIIEILWDEPSPKLKFQINNKAGEILYMSDILLSELHPNQK